MSNPYRCSRRLSWPKLTMSTRPDYQTSWDRHPASEQQIENSTAARAYAPEWTAPPDTRADMLDRAADLMEQYLPEPWSFARSWKTVRDASPRSGKVDFPLPALQAREHFSKPVVLPGPTGESNELSLHGRGVFACISPWNFPLAIFTGQVTAALAAGNTVLTKPAEQTPAIAAFTTRLLHQAGVPRAALQLLPGTELR
jgi:RHH-type proline utilization regulon transcriptional repressor/proline dehydrogenase/delta 1-pyrroline-5-carboxylate dehydrogenase